jgi:hypothetical protein
MNSYNTNIFPPFSINVISMGTTELPSNNGEDVRKDKEEKGKERIQKWMWWEAETG